MKLKLDVTHTWLSAPECKMTFSSHACMPKQGSTHCELNESEFTADRNAEIEGLTAEVRKLKQEKEALQNELQIARAEVCIHRLSLLYLSCVCR